ncbi:MAG TPA: translocation/assembly module TamB domain-containing protein, partial [Leptolyngbyaceae cyanobacterium M65_K2018_010]|nr:translocation/assembly module TamB domain-containing protein [Leptolyngbyaceae cyanobacterium M65_K2018_010]
PRSESDIVSLLSSGLLTALESTLGSVTGTGDNFQGLVTFAGSALLSRVQGLLGAGINRVDLRLFPASPAGSDAFDIGGEIGFNLSDNLSVSAQTVFSGITPPLFGVRYRIGDRLTLRLVTSYQQFAENSGAILEFGF